MKEPDPETMLELLKKQEQHLEKEAKTKAQKASERTEKSVAIGIMRECVTSLLVVGLIEDVATELLRVQERYLMDPDIKALFDGLARFFLAEYPTETEEEAAC